MNFSRVLVTGGAGFLGSNFVNRSLDLHPSIEITVLDSLTYAGRREFLPQKSERMTFIQKSILDEQVVESEVQKSDLVVHFAAETHNDRSLISPAIFFETNVLGTEVMARVAAKWGKRFHHVSTDEVFGDLPLSGPEKFTEESSYRPSSPYSASKAASDHLVRAYVRSFGLKATITNCTNNFGANQNWEKFIPSSVRSALAGQDIEIYGNGQNVRDWIHVDDHTDGIWKVINKGEIGQTYLLGGSNQIDNLSLARMILSILKREPTSLKFVQDRMGHDLRYAVDFTKASDELGWEPVKSLDFEAEFRKVVMNYVHLLRDGEKLD